MSEEPLLHDEPEPYDEPEPRVIYSRLMKADYLIGNSELYPVMVRAACSFHRVPYSDDALAFAATRPEILDALTMTEETVLDTVLRDFGTEEEAAVVMDDLILGAVQQYKAQLPQVQE